MTANTSDHAESSPSALGRSVQGYLDETPIWADGTALKMTPMTDMQ